MDLGKKPSIENVCKCLVRYLLGCVQIALDGRAKIQKTARLSSSFSFIDLLSLSCLNRRMATLDGDDLKAIKDLIEVTLDEKLDEKLDVKLSHLPTKDEFYEQTGKILKRPDDLEEEKDVLSHQVSGHSDRIEKIESHLGLTSD